MVKEWRGAGGQVWKGRILSLTKNSHRYSPAQTLYFLTHYTATKIHSRCWRSPLAKKKYTAGPHTPPLAHVDVHSVTIPFHAKKLSLLGRPWKNREGGRVREGGGCWKTTALPRGGTLRLLLAGILQKIWKSLRNLNGPFLTFCPPFLSLRSK